MNLVSEVSKIVCPRRKRIKFENMVCEDKILMKTKSDTDKERERERERERRQQTDIHKR